MRFEVEHPVRWVDVDSWNVVNNAVYLSLMEQARYEYFRALDLLDDGQVSFVLAEVGVSFRSPARMGEVLTLRAAVTRLGGSSFDMGYEVVRDGDLLAEGRAVLVWVDAGMRPVPVPDRARRALAAYEGIPERA